MAAKGPVQDLCDEATCSICLEYFSDPVTITECGHNFCQRCLTRYWWEEVGNALVVSCPQCRRTTQRKSFIPNWTLKNMVEITKQLRLGGQGVEGVCQKHQEPLKLFCEDHQAPICVVCDRSKEHEGHKVVPQEEAFQEYKDQMCCRLKILSAERRKILLYKAVTDKVSQDLLNQTEGKRQKAVAEFRKIHQFLDEQEKNLLAQIEEVEKEVARRRDEELDKLCRELSSLESLIQEMEEKTQQPANEFLQDIGNTLQRYKKKKEVFESPVAFFPELSFRINGFYDVKPLLEDVLKPFKAKVTLHPETAYPRLVLSKDCKSVRWGDKLQDLPNNPERFDRWPFVLGSEGFIADRHFWDITVEGEGDWAVGVVRKSVRRKGVFRFSPKEGIWAVGKRNGQYRAHNASGFIPLSLSQELQRVRVTLNYAEGQVSFSNADTGIRFHTYSEASFCGETLLPFFWVPDKAHLRISP